MLRALGEDNNREAVNVAVEELARYMRTKSFEYNQEHPNNEIIIKDIKQMSEGSIELDEVALNNLRSDYKQHHLSRNGKGQQGKQQGKQQKHQQKHQQKNNRFQHNAKGAKNNSQRRNFAK